MSSKDKYVTEKFCDERFQHILTHIEKQMNLGKNDIVGSLSEQIKELEKTWRAERKEEKTEVGLSRKAQAAIIVALITSIASIINTIILVLIK